MSKFSLSKKLPLTVGDVSVFFDINCNTFSYKFIQGENKEKHDKDIISKLNKEKTNFEKAVRIGFAGL